jgi:5-methylcytosine-specific restriction endonuclease McrA
MASIKTKIPKSIKIDWEKYEHLLGNQSDDSIAILIGCSSGAVINRRKKLNIKSYKETCGKWFNKKNINWEKYEHLLGTMSDIKLAKIIGCPEHFIKQRRYFLKIDSFERPSNKHELEINQQTCKECQQILPLENFEFNKKSSLYRRICKICNYKKFKNKRNKQKDECITLLGSKCQNCGFKKFRSSMQFHHIKDKSIEINNLIGRDYQKEKILIELDKCCLLCSNCHDAFHGSDIKLEFMKIKFGYTIKK